MGGLRPMRWLHISDLHFKSDERWDRRATLQALIRTAETLRRADAGPDVVFVTGDIAWSGQRVEYDQAERFFDRLAGALGLSYEEWFIVPGNHDVARDLVDTEFEITSDVLQSRAALRMVGTRLSEFYSFTHRLLGTARAWQIDHPWRTDVIERGGVSIAVLQLNSSWTCGSDADRNRIIIGERQIAEALRASADVQLRIALLHHPLSDLQDESVAESLLAKKVAFVLRGHLHRSRALIEESRGGKTLHISAGALYTEPRGYPRAFNIVDLNPARRFASVKFFRYCDRGRGFWTPDKRTYEVLRDGRWNVRF